MNKHKTFFKVFCVFILILAIVWLWPAAFHRPLVNDRMMNNPYGDAIDPTKPIQNDVLPGTVKQEPGADGYEDPVTETPYNPNDPDPIAPHHSADEPGDQVVCTMEAKQCPDGTYVGRQGPHCEFAPCPGN